MSDRNNGFTLAEVLITLMVIGVLAVVTIPSLMQAFEKMVLKNQAKRALSVFSQTLYKTMGEENFQCYYATSGKKIDECSQFFEQFFGNLKISQKCSGKGTINGCIPDYTDTVKSTESGCVGYWPTTNKYAYVMLDGSTAVSFGDYLAPLFLVDTNGIKPPNKAGYDVFSFYVYKKDTGEYYFGDAWGGCMNMDGDAYFKHKADIFN